MDKEKGKGLQKYPKVYYFTTKPNTNSILYIKLLTMLSHEFELLPDKKSVIQSIEGILQPQSILIIAKDSLKAFIKIMAKVKEARQGKKRLYVELETFTENISQFEGKMICLSPKAFPYLKCPVYANHEDIPIETKGGHNRMLVVYYDQRPRLQLLINNSEAAYIYPFHINLENAVADDRRFVTFEDYHRNQLPPYMFYIGPYSQRVITNIMLQTSTAACYWLPSFDDIHNYETFARNKHPCTIYYHKTLRSEYARQEFSTKGQHRFIEDRGAALDASWGHHAQDLNGLFKSSHGKEISYELYNKETFRKEWRHVLVCIHPDIEAEMFQFSKLFWVQTIHGKPFCNNTADFHLSKKSIKPELSYGMHMVLSPQDHLQNNDHLYEAANIEQLTAELHLAVARGEHIFRMLRVYVVQDSELFEYLIDESVQCIKFFEIDRLQNLPLLELRDHPFAVIVKDKIARSAYALLKGLHGVMVVFYETAMFTPPVTQTALYVLNPEEVYRSRTIQILLNFTNPNISKYDLTYNLRPVTIATGESKLASFSIDDHIMVRTFLANLEKRYQADYQEEAQLGKLICCCEGNIYSVLKELQPEDRVLMMADCPNYWKELYDRVPQIMAIGSSMPRLLRLYMGQLDIKIQLGLIRKDNRTQLSSVPIYIDLVDKEVATEVEQLFKNFFLIRKGLWKSLKSHKVKGYPYILVTDSHRLDRLEEVDLELIKNSFIFILECEDIKFSMPVFSRLTNVCLVTKKPKELIGEISHYSSREIKDHIKKYIKENYK